MKALGIVVLVLGFVVAETSSSFDEKISDLLDQLDNSDESQLYNRDLDERGYGTDDDVDEISDDDIDLLLSALDKREFDADGSDIDEESAIMQELRRELDLLNKDNGLGLSGRETDQMVDVEQRGWLRRLLRKLANMASSRIYSFLRRLGKLIRCIVCRRTKRPIVKLFCNRLSRC